MQSLITLSVSILTPTPNSPSAPSLFASIGLCPCREMWVSAQMDCLKEILVNPSDIQSVVTDGIHAGRWVLVSRHVVCIRITVCLCSLSFHSLHVVSSPPHDTSVNTSVTHIPSVACVCVCVCVCVCMYVCALHQTGFTVFFCWGQACFHTTCVSSGTLVCMCDRGLLCVQNATLSQVLDYSQKERFLHGPLLRYTEGRVTVLK